MPIQAPTSSSTYQSQGLASLQQTGITQTSPGGRARSITDAFGDMIGRSEGRKFTQIAQTLVAYATGTMLDLIGQSVGVTRLSGVTASADETDYNFVFYVTSGTFGQINNGNDITVPAGTVISTSDPNGPTYTVDAPVTLPAKSASVPFSATSTVDGTAGNAPAGVFTQMNFRGYADSRYGSLLVTNNYGVTEGQDDETDDNYRYRIDLKLQSTGGSAPDDIRGAILEVPGVQDVQFQYQAGTYIAYVYGVAQVASPSLLQSCQAQINATTAFPLSGVATAPDLVGISFSTTLTFVSGATAAEQQAAITSATAAAAMYINNIAINGTLVINEIANAVLQSNSNILDVGQPNQPLANIYIWRSRADGTRYSRYLVADYSQALGERIIVETSIATPITLTAKT